jgi:hypothetical protein
MMEMDTEAETTDGGREVQAQCIILSPATVADMLNKHKITWKKPVSTSMNVACKCKTVVEL